MSPDRRGELFGSDDDSAAATSYASAVSGFNQEMESNFVDLSLIDDSSDDE